MYKIYEQIAILSTLTLTSSILFTVLIIPLINKLGLRYGIIDKPNPRKIHKGNIVRLGGLGIFIGFALGTILCNIFLNEAEYFDITWKPNFHIIFGGLGFLILGLIDDVKTLSPYIRLGGQIIISSILFANGLKVQAIDLSWINSIFQPILLNNFFSFAFVNLWITGLTNAINWLDGLDGLASGLSIITASGLAYIFIFYEKWDLVFLCVAFSGSIIGFLRYNIYPAKIMMGDSGSYFLGSMLAIISIIGLSYSYQDNSSITLEVFPIIQALLIFFVPITDMSYVIFNRIRKGYSPFFPDKSHIHHNLLKRGFNTRSTVLILYTLASILIGITIFNFVWEKTLYICIGSILLSLAILYLINLKDYLDSKN